MSLSPHYEQRMLSSRARSIKDSNLPWGGILGTTISRIGMDGKS